MQKKLAKKIIKNIKETNLLDSKIIKEVEVLKREEISNLLENLIDLEENLKIKKRLIAIYENRSYSESTTLLILAIWVSFGDSVEESFNSKNII